jgi:signal transduction histidine kinase
MEERNRIARDLHDVVAHHVTAIAVQAEAAPLRARGEAAALTAEFATIRQTALSALGEMRGVLGRLRDDQETPFAPAVRDLSGLPGLVRSLEESGHPLDLDLTGVGVPGRVASVIHSVVKESLSNIRRHAPGAPTKVSVSRSTDAGRAGRMIVVDVVNGPPTRTPSMSGQEAGYGQRGMLERVNSVAGTLEVGHVSTGYRVHVELPVEVQ